MIQNINKLIRYVVLFFSFTLIVSVTSIFCCLTFIDEDRPADVMMPISFPARLKITFKYGAEYPYWSRMIKSVAFSALLYPLDAIESVRYESKISQQTIDDGPIFIIGHWRSGTTYLHTIMAHDDQFAYSNLLEVIAPKSFHILEQEIFREYLVKLFATSNEFDQSLLDQPGEEELAIASLCGHSYYFVNNYPSKSNYLFERYALLENLSEIERIELEESYIYFVKKLTYFNQGKTLVLKNPVNTARVDFLLKIFPNAKFVHIHRNPLDIFESMKKLCNAIHENSQLEGIDENELENQIILQYSQLMSAYLKQKTHIPEDRLIEISYNELVENPKLVLHEIYAKLDLWLNDEFECKLDQYLKSQVAHKKNVYTISEKNLQRLKREWKEFLLAFGYLNSNSES